MTALADALALAVGAAGVIVALGVAVEAGARAAVRPLLDFLLAAGLLRLGVSPGWDVLIIAALIVAIRHLVTLGLSLGTPPVRPSVPSRTLAPGDRPGPSTAP